MCQSCVIPVSSAEHVILTRGLLHVQSVEASFVVVAEVPLGSTDAATSVCQAFKEYFLHVQITSSVHEVSFLDPKKLTSYCDPPFEAAFTGIFLHEVALRMYFSLFHSRETGPLQADTISRNRRLLLSRARQEICDSA